MDQPINENVHWQAPTVIEQYAPNGHYLGQVLSADDPVVGFWEGISVDHHNQAQFTGFTQSIMLCEVQSTGRFDCRGYSRMEEDGSAIRHPHPFGGYLYRLGGGWYQVVYDGAEGATLVLARLDRQTLETTLLAAKGDSATNVFESVRFVRATGQIPPDVTRALEPWVAPEYDADKNPDFAWR